MKLDKSRLRLKLGKLRSERAALVSLKATAGTVDPDIKHLKKTIDRLKDQYQNLSGTRDPEEIKNEIGDLQEDIETFTILKDNLIVTVPAAALKIREYNIVITDRIYRLRKKQIAPSHAEVFVRERRFTREELKRVMLKLKEAREGPPKHELNPYEIEKQLQVIDVRIELVKKEVLCR